MKEGDFVRIDYVGKISESGEIFDLTKENLAKEKGIYDPKFKYGPVPIIIGAKLIMGGLEKKLKTMKVGEKKKIIVKSEDAFGNRNSKLIRLIPFSEFKRQKMDPYPGMPVVINKISGRVLSVSGGRVRVDFNHPLAGKTLEYDLEIRKKITNRREKVKAVIEFLLNIDEKDADVTIEKENAEIKIIKKEDIPKRIKKNIAEMITKWITSIKKVKFIEEY